MLFSPIRPAKLAAAVLCTALTAAACTDATVPLPQEGTPDALEFSWGGYTGGTSITLRGDTVVFRRSSSNVPPDSAKVVPSAEAWHAFWSATQRAGVGRWRGNYNAEQIADGVGWDVRIEAGGRQVAASGSNAFPDRFGHEHEGDVPDDFRIFLTALEDLVGRPSTF
jgi:hypothetical protein